MLRGGHGCATASVEIRRQPARVGSLLPSRRSPELNSGPQFSSKCLYVLSHPAGPCFTFLPFIHFMCLCGGQLAGAGSLLPHGVSQNRIIRLGRRLYLVCPQVGPGFDSESRSLPVLLACNFRSSCLSNWSAGIINIYQHIQKVVMCAGSGGARL